MGKAAVVLVDCDMYLSTCTVLDFLPAIMQKDTILLFDDWRLTEEDKGQRLACKEWMTRNPGIKLEEFCEFDLGQGFRVVEM